MYPIIACNAPMLAADIVGGLVIRNQTQYPVEVTMVAKGVRHTMQSKFVVRAEANGKITFAPNIPPTMGASTPMEIQKTDALLPKHKKITYQVNESFHYAYNQPGPSAIITISLRNKKQLSYTYQVGYEL